MQPQDPSSSPPREVRGPALPRAGPLLLSTLGRFPYFLPLRNLCCVSPSALWSPTRTLQAPPRLLRYVYPAQRDPPGPKSLLAGPHRVAGYERRCCTRLRNSLGAHSAHALLLQSSQSKTQDGLSTPSVKVSDWRSCTIWNCVSWPCTQTPPFPHFVTRLHRQPNST